ncbi:MAG: exosortase/archaeosortase family protein, partial [Planctomycetaceae bacterium]
MSSIETTARPQAEAGRETVHASVRKHKLHQESVMMCIVGGLAIFGHFPLLVEHISDLMLRPHYQFILFLPVGAALLVMERRRDQVLARSGTQNIELRQSDIHPAKLRYSLALVVIALVALAAAVWIWSARVAMISAMLTAFSLILAFGGRGLLRIAFPAWLLLWLAMPLPFNRDYWLIAELRDVTTRWASRVLDQIGVLHLVNGNIIELPGQKLFVADACSGIHSLYVLLAFALFIGLYLHRRALHVILLLLSTFGIVLVENVMRITGVAAGLHAGFDMSSGWKHSTFGGVLFVLSLMLVFTTDQFFAFLLPDQLFRSFWNRRGIGPRLQIAADESTKVRSVGRWLVPFGVAFALLGMVQLVMMPANG